MDRAGGWRCGAAEWPRRLATVPYAPAVAAGLVGVAAAAQALAQPGNYGGSYSGDLQVAFVLLSLFGTLPLGLLWAYPTAAALAVCVASVLSLTALVEPTAIPQRHPTSMTTRRHAIIDCVHS